MPRARRAPASPRPIDVLVVCTGNLCRSPMIATLLQYALPGKQIRSVGTHAVSGSAWHPSTIDVLTEAGYHAQGTAHRLRKSHVRNAKLILTAEGMHRGVVVGMDDTAADRTYTLLEAARLLGEVPSRPGVGANALALHLALALRMRPDEFDDDLADPILGDLDDFRACLAAVRTALDVIVPPLAD